MTNSFCEKQIESKQDLRDQQDFQSIIFQESTLPSSDTVPSHLVDFSLILDFHIQDNFCLQEYSLLQFFTSITKWYCHRSTHNVPFWTGGSAVLCSYYKITRRSCDFFDSASIFLHSNICIQITGKGGVSLQFALWFSNLIIIHFSLKQTGKHHLNEAVPFIKLANVSIC